jgi:hypothetical protein
LSPVADWLGDADVFRLRVGAAAGDVTEAAGACFRVLLGSGEGVGVAVGPGVVAAPVALDDSVRVGVDDGLAVELGLALADGAGAEVSVGVGAGAGVLSCTGSHDWLLATVAELAALAGLATVARLNSEAAVSRTPPANRVTAAGRACANRMKRPTSAARCCS